MKKKTIKKKITPLNVILCILLGLYAASLIFLLVWSLLNSLKPYSGPKGIGSFRENPFWFPKGWIWEWKWSNYGKILTDFCVPATGTLNIYLEELFFNSFLYSLGCAAMLTITPCLVAYATAKYNFKFNAVINTVVIVALALPIVGALPSEIQTVKKLGLYDSFFGVFIMKMNFLSMYYLVFLASFKGLSKTYADAAYIDGAGEATVCFRIMLPLVKNTIFTIMLIQFINCWNDFQTPMIYLPTHPTMAYGLYLFVFVGRTTVDAMGNTVREGSEITDRLAAATVMLIPILALFMAFHEKLIGNLTMGGIKE